LEIVSEAFQIAKLSLFKQSDHIK